MTNCHIRGEAQVSSSAQQMAKMLIRGAYLNDQLFMSWFDGSFCVCFGRGEIIVGIGQIDVQSPYGIDSLVSGLIEQFDGFCRDTVGSLLEELL